MTFSFLIFLNHTPRRTTVGRTPLDEWSARHRVMSHIMMLNSSNCYCRGACDSCRFPLSVTVPSLPTYTISVRSQFIHGPHVVRKFQLLCLRAKSHFEQIYETAVTRTVNTIFIGAPCISYSHWISTPTNAHTYNFYNKTIKIAPTCFDPKIIFRELHCSLLKPHFFKNTHWLNSLSVFKKCDFSKEQWVYVSTTTLLLKVIIRLHVSTIEVETCSLHWVINYLCWLTLLSITLLCTVLYDVLCTVWCTVYCTVLYCVLYCTVYCTVLYCTVLYCTVLYCMMYWVLYSLQLCCISTIIYYNIDFNRK